MKKITYLLYLFIAMSSVLIVSCDKDDDKIDEPVTAIDVQENELFGAWEMTGFNVDDGKVTTFFQGQPLASNTFTQKGTAYDYVLTFSEDPQTVSGIGSYDVEVVSTTLGQTQTQNLTVDSVSGFDTASWNIVDGKTLKTKSGQGDEVVEGTMEIVELTTSTLRLKVDLATAEKGTLDGLGNLDDLSDLGIEIKGNLYMTFSR